MIEKVIIIGKTFPIALPLGNIRVKKIVRYKRNAVCAGTFF